MRHTILLFAVVASLGATPVFAGDLSIAYFEGTEPGSWAKYLTTMADGAKSAATYTRLTDESGGLAVEIASEFLEGPGAGGESTSIFTVAPDFDWKRRFLSFGKALTGATFVMEGRPPMPQPESMVEAMRAAMADFAGGFEAMGKATHEGVECDLYAFHGVLGGPNPGTMTGEICLSPSVPFGVVHQTATSRSESAGESSFETRLVGSGAGAPRTVPGGSTARSAGAPPAGKAERLNIALAYQRGVIALDFRVRANTGGRALEVALTNLGAEPLVIGVGTSTYAFEVGPPVGTLFFQPVYEQEIELAAGETSSEFHAAQIADRGVREGSFRLAMVRGVPTLSGSVTVGKIK